MQTFDFVNNGEKLREVLRIAEIRKIKISRILKEVEVFAKNKDPKARLMIDRFAIKRFMAGGAPASKGPEFGWIWSYVQEQEIFKDLFALPAVVGFDFEIQAFFDGDQYRSENLDIKRIARSIEGRYQLYRFIDLPNRKVRTTGLLLSLDANGNSIQEWRVTAVDDQPQEECIKRGHLFTRGGVVYFIMKSLIGYNVIFGAFDNFVPLSTREKVQVATGVIMEVNNSSIKTSAFVCHRTSEGQLLVSTENNIDDVGFENARAHLLSYVEKVNRETR